MTYIERKSKVKCPNKMYKYFTNLEFAINSIKNDSIYFDKVASFNDPFECYSELIYFSDPQYFHLINFYLIKNKLIDKDEIINIKEIENKIKKIKDFDIYNQIMRYLNLNSDFIKQKIEVFPYVESKCDLFIYILEQTKDSSEPKLRISKELIINYFCEKWNLQNYKQGMIDSLIQDNSGKVNLQDQHVEVSCFSERKDSILMWAYYANSHRGICLEYDFSDEENKRKTVRVLYKKMRIFNSNNWFRLKSYCWKHEKEWRIAQIPPINDSKVVVKNIYFGCNFDYVNIKNYHKIVILAKNKGIGMYRATQNKNTYQIDFIPILNNGFYG